MLGIRRARGIAIDVWCGPASHFAADRHDEAVWHDRALTNAGGLHLAFSFPQQPLPQSVDDFFLHLSDALNKLDAAALPRRVSMLVPTRADYDDLLAALNRTFLEEPCD